MSKVGVVLLGAAVALASVGTALANTTLPRGYSAAVQTSIYPGIDYQELVNRNGPVLAHVAHISPGAPVDLRVVSASDKVPNQTSDLETTSAMCRRTRCVVGVNGDFHTNAQPIGGVVTGGRMLRTPPAGRPQLTIDTAGHLTAGEFPWSAWLRLSDGVQLPITGINVPATAGAVLYTSDWGSATPSPGVELVIRPSAPLGGLNQATAVELQGLRQGPAGIPAGGAVLSVPAIAADQLNGVWAKIQQGAATTHAEVEVETPINARDSMGVMPVVLHNGQPALPWPNDANIVSAVQPRTLVAWNAAGDTFIVVVDGRQTSSAGLTMAQAADMLLGLGATEAVNLDGGGGSTFVVGSSIWNQPSDQPNRPPQYAERVAANTFLALPGPGGPPAPASPPRPAPPATTTTTTAPAPPVVLGPPAPGPGPRPGGGTTPAPGAPLPTHTSPGGAVGAPSGPVGGDPMAAPETFLSSLLTGGDPAPAGPVGSGLILWGAGAGRGNGVPGLPAGGDRAVLAAVDGSGGQPAAGDAGVASGHPAASSGVRRRVDRNGWMATFPEGLALATPVATTPVVAAVPASASPLVTLQVCFLAGASFVRSARRRRSAAPARS